MESSSSDTDSFLWTDASSDSSSNNNMPKKSDSSHHIQELETNADHHSTLPKSLSKNEAYKLHKGTKKRKGTDTPDTTNHFHSEEKRIKMEPDSDFEVKKKKTRKKGGIVNNDYPNNSILDDEMYSNNKVKDEQASIASEVVKPKKKKKRKKSDSEEFNHVDENIKEIKSYLDMEVKEEQVSSIPTEDVHSKKKKKCKSFYSNIDNNAQSVEEEKSSVEEEEENSIDMESYLNLRVKQEQASEIKTDQLKSKMKKKHQSSVSDTENKNESKSVHLNSTTEANSVSACSEQSDVEYTIIDEKFSAEETIIQKPKKKKHKKDIVNHSATCDTSQENSDGDISLQPVFLSNDIVSSTLINTSIESKIIPNQKTNKISDDNTVQHDNKLQRITKISDRIRFEDDENSSQGAITNKLPSKIQDFLRKSTSFQVASQTPSCMITDDDEIWILRCPPEMDHVKLKNMKLLVEGKCKVKINRQTFDGVPNEDQNRITLLTNWHGHVSVNNFPVKGSIIYRKRIPKAHVPENVNMINNQTRFIPLPETKCRHPLFGPKYKKAMKIPAEIGERLEAAKSRQFNDSNDNSVKKKKKKQKNKSIDIKEEAKLSPEPEVVRKSRKRKLSQDTNVPYKKRKQIKHDPDSDPAKVWESEKAIEENLFNF